MTRADIDALFELLALYCPKDQRLKQSKLKSIWFETLKPYDRNAVKEAVLWHFRGHNFLPTASEICIRCGHPIGPKEAEAIEAQKRIVARAKKEIQRLIPLRRAAGIPATEDERKAAGMPFSTWMRVLEAAGLGYPGGVFCEAANGTI